MIKVLIKADSWYPIDRKRVRKLTEEFLVGEMGVGSEMVVGLTVVGDRKMKELNKKYLHKNGTTDVLSFSQTEDVEDGAFVEPMGNGLYLGDVVVSWPQAVKQALEQQITVDEEIDFLVKHGLLHLMGVHHD